MEEKKSIVCNCCGTHFSAFGNVVEKDFLHVKKQWGYFSKKDGRIDEFFVCESCYDKWMENFVICPKERMATEFL